MGKIVGPEGLANNRSFKQCSRGYKLIVGANDEKSKVLLEWAELRETNAPTIVLETSSVSGAALLAISASLLMRTDAITQAHSIMDKTPMENGLEVLRGLVQRVDPSSAHANLNLMSNILKLPKGNIENTSFLIETWEEMVWRQDERTGRQAPPNDTKQASMMDMCARRSWSATSC